VAAILTGKLFDGSTVGGQCCCPCASNRQYLSCDDDRLLSICSGYCEFNATLFMFNLMLHSSFRRIVTVAFCAVYKYSYLLTYLLTFLLTYV